MKIKSGRGIQFFKHPVFNFPKNFAVKTFKDSKKHVSNLVGGVSNFSKKISNNKKTNNKKNRKKK